MKAYIYKIKRKDCEFEVYIGQTIQRLKARLWYHFRSECNPEFKEWLFKNGKENIEILPIEEFEYDNIENIENKLNEREEYWTNFYKNCEDYKCFTIKIGTSRTKNKRNAKQIEINGIIYNSIREAIRCLGWNISQSLYGLSSDERKIHYQQNKEKIKNYGKKYIENNKEKIKDYNKKWKENNKDYIKNYLKEYYEDNKDKIKETRKEYYENNKDNIKETRKEYYEDNKEKIILGRKDYINDYYEDNKDKIKEKKKDYYEDNKEKIKEKSKDYYEKIENIK